MNSWRYTFILHEYEDNVIIKIIWKFQEILSKTFGTFIPHNIPAGVSGPPFHDSKATNLRPDYYGTIPGTLDILFFTRAFFQTVTTFVRLFVGLIGFNFTPSRIFHSEGDLTIGEGLQIWTILGTGPLIMSNEGSWTCHTYCGTGYSFTLVILEDPWHSDLWPSV